MRIGHKQIEKMLSNYKVEKANLENLRIMLSAELETGIQGVTYEERVANGGISRPTEDLVIKRMEKDERIGRKAKALENRLTMLENAVASLTSEEKNVIEGRYFEGLQWWQIAGILKYGESWCKRLRRGALEKIAYTFAVTE